MQAELSHESPKKLSVYYSKLRSEIKVYSNVTCILDKIESDNNMSLLTTTFQHILDQEMVYAVSGKLIRAQEAKAAVAGSRPSVPALDQHAHVQGEPQANRREFE